MIIRGVKSAKSQRFGKAAREITDRLEGTERILLEYDENMKIQNVLDLGQECGSINAFLRQKQSFATKFVITLDFLTYMKNQKCFFPPWYAALFCGASPNINPPSNAGFGCRFFTSPS